MIGANYRRERDKVTVGERMTGVNTAKRRRERTMW